MRFARLASIPTRTSSLHAVCLLTLCTCVIPLRVELQLLHAQGGLSDSNWSSRGECGGAPGHGVGEVAPQPGQKEASGQVSQRADDSERLLQEALAEVRVAARSMQDKEDSNVRPARRRLQTGANRTANSVLQGGAGRLSAWNGIQA